MYEMYNFNKRKKTPKQTFIIILLEFRYFSIILEEKWSFSSLNMSVSMSNSFTMTLFWRRGFILKYENETELQILLLIKNGPVLRRGRIMKFYKHPDTRTTGM